MVPPFLSSSNSGTSVFSTFSGLTFFSFQRLSPSLENSFPGGRDLIRLSFTHRRVPLQALEITLASLTDSTIKQYTKPLREWWLFCRSSAVSLFSPTPTQFLEFLAQQSEREISYSSINVIRSAVSLITERELGNHPLITRFCKGSGVLRPPRPRYDFVWDPAPIIAKLGTLYPYSSLSLEVISKKLVLLLALGTGQRVQTLASLKLSQIFLDNKLIIRVPDRIKISAPGRPQPYFFFSPFDGNESLCIYKIVKHYLEITKGRRTSSGDAFLISFVKPHKAVTRQTISRWIRSGLEDCEVKTDVFSAHSTRHASTSLTAQKGVALDLIKRAAGWSGQSRVFASFYNRPIINPEDFSNAVLRA